MSGLNERRGFRPPSEHGDLPVRLWWEGRRYTMLLKRIWYLVTMLIVLTPIALLDAVVSRLESGVTEYIIRMVLLVLAFLVFRMIPAPKKP